jgi:hypothetical protein
MKRNLMNQRPVVLQLTVYRDEEGKQRVQIYQETSARPQS